MAQNVRLPENLPDQPSMAALVGDIITDAQKLVRQEMALARTELQEEWVKTKVAIVMLGATLTSAVIAGILVTFGIVYLLGGPVGLPLWLSFLIVAVAIGASSFFLLQKGKEALGKVNFVPRETVESMKENVQWIRNQT